LRIPIRISKSAAESALQIEFVKVRQREGPATGIDGRFFGDWFIAWPKGRSIFWSFRWNSPGFYLGQIVRARSQTYLTGRLFASFATVFRSVVVLLATPIVMGELLRQEGAGGQHFFLFCIVSIAFLGLGLYGVFFTKCPLESKKQIFAAFERILPPL